MRLMCTVVYTYEVTVYTVQVYTDEVTVYTVEVEVKVNTWCRILQFLYVVFVYC